MEEKVRLSYLFDMYGNLLKPAQRDLFERFVFYDFSLSEIADEEGTSRQAVHEKIKRIVASLENYEDGLLLLEKDERIKDIVSDIRENLAGACGLDKDRVDMLLESLLEVL